MQAIWRDFEFSCFSQVFLSASLSTSLFMCASLSVLYSVYVCVGRRGGGSLLAPSLPPCLPPSLSGHAVQGELSGG